MLTLCSRRTLLGFAAVLACALFATAPASAEEVDTAVVGVVTAAPCANPTPDVADLLRGDQAVADGAAVCSSSEAPSLGDSLNARLGYCKCGCSTARCRTSADCGGAACLASISCC